MTIGEKIKKYRLQKSYSLQQLADLAGMSKASIQQYEDGVINPSNKALLNVANALRTEIWNFFDDSDVKLELAEFRHGEKLTDSANERERIHDLVIDYSRDYIELEDILTASICFENPIDDLTITSYRDVEKAAEKVRKKWKLGSNPINDICSLLESKGFKIIPVVRETESPGICGFIKEDQNMIPFIIINTFAEHIRELTRKRFTILHEAGHLMLRFGNDVDKDQEEKYCNSFASAVLLPFEALIEYLGKERTTIALDELKEIKETFGISVQSIIYRANSVGLINDSVCSQWIKLYESWRQEGKTFGDFTKSKEEPLRFKRLITRAYAEKRISKEKVSEILGLKIEEVDKSFGSDKLSLI